MPCFDGRTASPDYYDQLQTEKKRIQWFEAALCATLTALNSNYDALDFTEAGVQRKDLVKWHEAHKAKDAIRREREAQARKEKEEKAAKAKAKKALLAKLTPEERELLGV